MIPRLLASSAVATLFVALATPSSALVLVVDRTTNSVYSYTDAGVPQHSVLDDNALISQPSGLVVSPDLSTLYITSSINERVVAYDYNSVSARATNARIFADASDGLAFPNGIVFSPDGETIYVSNQNGSGVARFKTNGDLVGPPLTTATPAPVLSGFAYSPAGELLVGEFATGSVLYADGSGPGLSTRVPANLALTGAAGLLVDDNDLYVAGLFTGAVLRFDATTGVQDPTFGIGGLSFPQGLMAAPDGNGMLVGVLGTATIQQFSFDGASLGAWATAGAGGFSEPTAFISIVPEPAGFAMLAMGAVGWGLARRHVTLA